MEITVVIPSGWSLRLGSIWTCGEGRKETLKKIRQCRFNHQFCLYNLGLDGKSKDIFHPSSEDGSVANASETFKRALVSACLLIFSGHSFRWWRRSTYFWWIQQSEEGNAILWVVLAAGIWSFKNMQGPRRTDLFFSVPGHQRTVGHHRRTDQEDKRLLMYSGLHLGCRGDDTDSYIFWIFSSWINC